MGTLTSLLPKSNEDAFEQEMAYKMKKQHEIEASQPTQDEKNLARDKAPEAAADTSIEDMLEELEHIENEADPEDAGEKTVGSQANEAAEAPAQDVSDEPDRAVSEKVKEAPEEQTAAHDPFTAAPQTINLPVASQSPEQRAELEYTGLHSAVVTCGDEVPDMVPDKVLSIDEKMRNMGFPARPKLWPAVMAWPMQPDFNLMIQRDAKRKAVEEYLEGMKAMQARMLKRAEEIDSYIRQHNPQEFHDNTVWRRSLAYSRFGRVSLLWKLNQMNRVAEKHARLTVHDPYYGVRWASLLDEKSTRPAANIVNTWSHNYAITNDGGKVIAGTDNIRFKKVTQQAIALSIHEGVARGWETIKMQGPQEFAKAAIQAAKQANVRAEITEFYGPYGMFKRKHVVMPTPPGARREEPRVETTNLGATPDSENARKPLTNEEIEQDRKQVTQEKLKALGKQAKPEEAEKDVSTTEVVPKDEEDTMSWTQDGVPEPSEPEHNSPA
jgi:hypothetical protein